MPDGLLLTVALLFALANGMNDGGSILALAARVQAWPPVLGAAALGAGLVVVPSLVGVQVATTVASSVVPFTGSRGQAALLASTVAAVGVVGCLVRVGLPTSMTLANVGAIAGAGAAAGLPVRTGEVLLVLLAGAAAPAVGGASAWLLAAVEQARPRSLRSRPRVVGWHAVGFAAQVVGYGLNDGQRTVAVLAVAVGVAPAALPVGWLVVAGALFAIGAAAGFGLLAPTFATDLVATRPQHAAAAEGAAGVTAVLASLLGAPVSMTQTVSGGLIAAAGRREWRMVRWHGAARLVAAWVVTLPAGVAAGAALGAWARLV